MKKIHVIFLCILSVSVGASGFLALLNSPYFGFIMSEREGRWLVDSVAPGSPAEKANIISGMVITAINGERLTQYSLISDFDMIPDFNSLRAFWRIQNSLGKAIKPGSSAIFSLQDEQGKVSDVAVTPKAFQVSEVARRTASLYISALYCLAIGLAVALKRKKDSRAELFFVLLFTVSLILFTFGSWSSRDLVGNPALMYLLAIFNLAYAFPFFPMIFFHFCLSFPERAKILNRKGFIAAMYMVPIVVLAIYIPRFLFEIYMLYWAGGLAGGVVVMIIRYFRDKNPLHRAQIKWILWGTTIFGIGMCITYALPLLTRSYSAYSYLLPSLAFLLIPSTFAMAILRFKLLEIDTLFDATFAYTLSAGLFIGFHIGLALLLGRLLQLGIAEQYIFASIVTILLVIFFYVPIKERLLVLVKRLFKREIYQADKVALALSNQLIMADSEQKVLSIFSDSLLSALHPKWIYYSDENAPGVFPASLSMMPAAVVGSLHAREIPSAMGIDSILSQDEIQPQLSGSAVIPLRMKKSARTFVVTGPKTSGNLYSSKDLSLLDSMGSLTTLAMDEIHEHEQRKRAEEEKEADHVRISREIHDGIGGMLANAIMISDIVLSERVGDHIHSRIVSIRSLLSQCLADLRAMIWALRDSDSNFADFASSVQSHALNMMESHSIQLEFLAQATDGACPLLSATSRANLFRAIQEFIANSIRHGKPSCIKIQLQESVESLAIEYSDDGRGCDLATSVDSGYGLSNINARIHSIGGVLAMRSSPGHGFSASIAIPLATGSST